VIYRIAEAVPAHRQCPVAAFLESQRVPIRRGGGERGEQLQRGTRAADDLDRQRPIENAAGEPQLAVRIIRRVYRCGNGDVEFIDNGGKRRRQLVGDLNAAGRMIAGAVGGDQPADGLVELVRIGADFKDELAAFRPRLGKDRPS
jgi:hypothetical protein